ncbi:hypothetical protein POM88_000504 [Heracleum sosnowskyi]|uniref:Wall-associated receptor kinase galacturonan-binding domain-containing protein n=1 Tax=Heracleum sosnowskyi TaxID=360622 RepID=A0AAD8JBB3_9APIA|nr:hypothetical protein POM88_000504 [Heracleum sosnowskyi]
MAMHLVLLQMILAIVFMQETSARVSSIAMPECPERCGDVTIPYPFGIGENCSLDWRIEIYCDRILNPPKPFPYYSELEVLNISVLEGTIQVKNPVLKDCTTGSLTQEVVFVYNPFDERNTGYNSMNE